MHDAEDPNGQPGILILCADGLSGIKEAIAAAYPKTEYQRCIVHQVRNTLKYVADKDRKPFANDLKTIYQAPSEEQSLEALERVTEKWSVKYPNSIKSWKQNWGQVYGELSIMYEGRLPEQEISNKSVRKSHSVLDMPSMCCYI